MTGRATLVGPVAKFPGDARLYKLDPPHAFRLVEEGLPGVTHYAVVSVIPGETAVFAADQWGNLLSWKPIRTQGRGYHGSALEAVGYIMTGEAREDRR